MAKIPQDLILPELPFMDKIHEGKVRATYSIPGNAQLLQWASDRISIFNFILNGTVSQKGEILTALTVFWQKTILKNFPSHLLVYGKNVVNQISPGNIQSEAMSNWLMRSSLIIKRLDLLPIEAIVRGCLTGSGWKDYQKSGRCYNHVLPPDLWDGACLPYPIFTPTEKSDDDPPIHHDVVGQRFGAVPERTALQIYMMAQKFALTRGIVLADTKFEMDKVGVLGDEWLTPDSSRCWDLSEWLKCNAEKKSPTSLDKEFTRRWGKSQGIDKLDPTNPEHIKMVEQIGLPEDIAKTTGKIYRYIFWRLTGNKLEFFQKTFMGIENAEQPKVNISVVVGSQSDLPQMNAGLNTLKLARNVGLTDFSVNVISCHRNSVELSNFAEWQNPEVVIAGAGLAAALPGILKAHYNRLGKSIPVIGVAFEGKNQLETQAAQLSIEQLPGQPVELDSNGKAFTGSLGFHQACDLAINGEFMPAKPSALKPAIFNLDC